jgi:squalene-hopene/tetraprenyl-beta-curcumene cyclase
MPQMRVSWRRTEAFQNRMKLEQRKKQSAVPRFGRLDADMADVESAIAQSREFLLSQQHPDGYWCGELEGDSMLEAEYILMHTLLESGDPARLQRAFAEMMRYQCEDGSWNIYPGGPGNISRSVECYAAAKIMGLGADDPRMAKCRGWVLAHGGVVECNTFTKMYLCSLGEYDYDAVPAVPPEIVLFPKWFYFNINEISSWSRSILVPLAIMYARKPFKKLQPEQGIDELFVGGRAKANLRLHWDRKSIVSWRNFFIALDRVLHLVEAVHIRPLRTLALKRAEKWLLERLEMSDGLGAIYPAMLNAIIALRCLGYSEDDPQVIRARDEFEKLGIEEPANEDMPEPTFRMQPCVSPVWDTAQAVFALGEAGVPRNDPRLLKAVDWMLSKEVRHRGDWAAKVPNTEPGGWYFEFNNEFYPDTDDTAQVLMALNKVDNPRERYQHQVVQRAIDWEWAMQCRNGGWGSFDKDNTKMIFQYIPFADHNAGPADGGYYRAHSGDAGDLWLYARRQARGEGSEVHPQRAAAGWKLVWALGRELHLRDIPGAARTGRHWRGSSGAADTTGRGMDSHGSEFRWRLGRDLRQLRRPGYARRGAEYPVADGLGAAWPAGRRR